MEGTEMGGDNESAEFSSSSKLKVIRYGAMTRENARLRITSIISW
jgi:hypothetical protein